METELKKTKQKVRFLYYEKIKKSGKVDIGADYCHFHEAQPKHIKHFSNLETGRKFSFTDVDGKVKKRKDLLDDFEEKYKPLKIKKEVTVLNFVINANDYPVIGKVINNIFKKRLKRMGIDVLGYVYVLDIDENNVPHFHLFLATNYMEDNQFKKFLHRKNHRKFNVIYMWNAFAILEYCKKKKVYVNKNGKNVGRSRKFN